MQKEDQDEDMFDYEETTFIGNNEDHKSSLDDDYYSCVVRKPRNEEPYGEDDLDFMSFLTDPTGETNCFEVVNKVSKERERKEMIMRIEDPR